MSVGDLKDYKIYEDINICREIGKNIKEWRLMRGFTQGNLGDKVGVTFQQIQKYESGINTISIDRLYAITRALSVDVTALLSHTPHEGCFAHKDDKNNRDILELVREYQEIKSEESRKAVRSLIRSLTSSKD